MKLGITMPTRTVELRRVPEYARLAEEAGLDSGWDWELYRNPFTMLAMSAQVTDRIGLGTGLAVSASRSPFEMANEAADVDELSAGRMLLGVGSGVLEFASAFHDKPPTKPLTRVSEYLDVLRLSWQYLRTGEAADYQGEFHSFTPPPFNPWGVRHVQRPTIPVYLGAIGPKMLNLVGRKADGWIGYLQRLHRGARRVDRRGQRAAVGDDDRGPGRLREDQRRAGAHLLHHRHPGRGSGPADWEGIVDHLVFHTQYVPPFTAAESEDAFRNICGAFAR